MEKKYSEIINDGKKTGKTIAEINAELAAAGADFHLAEESTFSWSEREMTEGFIPAEKEPEDAKHLRDIMKRDPAKAGLKLTVSVAEGSLSDYLERGWHPCKGCKTLN